MQQLNLTEEQVVYIEVKIKVELEKMSDAVAGGTGPHYYQELYTSPHEFDKLFLVDNYMQVSNDGGKTFTRMNESEKHVDNRNSF